MIHPKYIMADLIEGNATYEEVDKAYFDYYVPLLEQRIRARTWPRRLWRFVQRLWRRGR